MSEYRDRWGIYHHKKTAYLGAHASENGPMFTGLAVTTFKHLRVRKRETCLVIKSLFKNGTWRTTPLSPETAGFSHDNFKGLVAMLEYVKDYDEKFYNDYKKMVPLFHKQLVRPDNFFLVGYFKYPWLFGIFLPYVWFTFFLTCYQTHKVRNGVKILKTDGKLLAEMMCLTFKWDRVYKICTKILQRNNRTFEDRRVWLDWSSVHFIYFQDSEHDFLNKKARA